MGCAAIGVAGEPTEATNGVQLYVVTVIYGRMLTTAHWKEASTWQPFCESFGS